MCPCAWSAKRSDGDGEFRLSGPLPEPSRLGRPPASARIPASYGEAGRMRQLLLAMPTSCWPRVLFVSVLLGACVSADRGSALSPVDQGAPAEYGYQIVKVYPHDSRAYTQGLVYRDGVLFESTGLNGRSTLRKVRLETGEVLQQHQLEPRVFRRGPRGLERSAHPADLADEGRLRLRPQDVQAAQAVCLHRRGVGTDARRQAADHERRRTVGAIALSGPRVVQGDLAASRFATTAGRWRC